MKQFRRLSAQGMIARFRWIMSTFAVGRRRNPHLRPLDELLKANTPSNAKIRLAKKAEEVFFRVGYDVLTMATLATLCHVSRRSLYHHFNSKDDIFRTALELSTREAAQAAENAAQEAISRGESAANVLAIWLDTRFGEIRRRIGASEHGKEINEVAFRVAMDWMIGVSIDSNRRIARLLEQLQNAGRLVLRSNIDVHKAARLLGDAARGVNQARPPVPNDLIAQFYYDVADAVLFGCAEPAPRQQTVRSSGKIR